MSMGASPSPLSAAASDYVTRPQRASDFAAGGGRIIGFVGADTPRELIVASGALPYRLHSGHKSPSEEAVGLLGPAIDPVYPSILTQLLDGQLDFLSGLILSRDCEASLRLFYVLRQLTAQRPSLPPVHLVDILHLPRESTARYNRAQVELCAQVLETWTGRKPAGAALQEAISQYRDLRGQLHRSQNLRRLGKITGSESLHLFALGESMYPAAAAALVAAAVSERETAPTLDVPRIFFSGSTQDQDVVYSTLESCGYHIVGEDHDWGGLQLTLPTDNTAQADMEDPLTGLAVAYQHRGPAAATSSLRTRAAWSAEQAEACHSDVVLCYTRSFDDSPAWDYPIQRDLLLARGIPSSLLSRQSLAPAVDELRRTVSQLFDPVSAQ
jgi:benzoyl-CoA reductase/2-hydroxyglutaryl-CoA dehydratase subunit BcrC/BadD/HgdB